MLARYSVEGPWVNILGAHIGRQGEPVESM